MASSYAHYLIGMLLPWRVILLYQPQPNCFEIQTYIWGKVQCLKHPMTTTQFDLAPNKKCTSPHHN
jgi:hypothetical protein